MLNRCTFDDTATNCIDARYNWDSTSEEAGTSINSAIRVETFEDSVSMTDTNKTEQHEPWKKNLIINKQNNKNKKADSRTWDESNDSGRPRNHSFQQN